MRQSAHTQNQLCMILALFFKKKYVYTYVYSITVFLEQSCCVLGVFWELLCCWSTNISRGVGSGIFFSSSCVYLVPSLWEASRICVEMENRCVLISALPIALGWSVGFCNRLHKCTIRTHTRAHTRTCTCTHVCPYMHTHTHMRMHMHMHIHSQTNTHTPCTHTQTHRERHTHA